jgi:hypothetical protein
MPNVTLMATITLSQLNREEWEEAGFDPEDYADGHGGAVGAITPTLLAAAPDLLSFAEFVRDLAKAEGNDILLDAANEVIAKKDKGATNGRRYADRGI